MRRIAIALMSFAAGCTSVDDLLPPAPVAEDVIVAADADGPADAGPIVAEDLLEVLQPDLTDPPKADLVHVCGLSLAGVADSDFTISFDVTTKPLLDVPQPILNQREVCDSKHAYWSVEMASNGSVNIYLTDARLASNSPINDGKMHHVQITRRVADGGLIIAIDGRADAGPMPSRVMLDDRLPPLEMVQDSACGMDAQGVNVASVCLSSP